MKLIFSSLNSSKICISRHWRSTLNNMKPGRAGLGEKKQMRKMSERERECVCEREEGRERVDSKAGVPTLSMCFFLLSSPLPFISSLYLSLFLTSFLPSTSYFPPSLSIFLLLPLLSFFSFVWVFFQSSRAWTSREITVLGCVTFWSRVRVPLERKKLDILWKMKCCVFNGK